MRKSVESFYADYARGSPMALLNQSVQVYGKLGQLFEKLREGQAPDKFTREFLKDLDFKSSNWHAAINLLKGLGFLLPDGSPSSQYMDFLDKTRWQTVLATAVKKAYSDIFVMKREPVPSDVPRIAGKYKSTYNMSDTAADRAARTFMALLELSDKEVVKGEGDETGESESEPTTTEPTTPAPTTPAPTTPAPEAVKPTPAPAQHSQHIAPRPVGLNYNIQIHLPATKDIEVYNAIFKSLQEHIIG